MAGDGNNKNTNYIPAGKNTSIPLPPNQFQIPLNSLFTSVFGIAGPLIRRYKVQENIGETNNDLFYQLGEVSAPEVSPDTVTSYLGTPIQFWTKFKYGAYYKRENGEIVSKIIPETFLPHATVATFSRAHRDTETPMSGQQGSVVEEYGFEAWDIRFQGFVINNPKEGTVADQVKRLQKWENLSDAIDVAGPLFQWLEIDQISFKNIGWLPNKSLNLESVMPFEIHARSHHPIIL